MTTLAPGWQRIVGHEWAVRLLSGAVAHGRVGHAYLFTGPDHIGKMTLARTFAAALNCQAEPAARPCGHCRACRFIAADKHPDVRVVVPEISDRGTPSIKIEHIRRLQQDLSLSAYEARYKVALLRRFDTANLNAANAFLKTLEEPPANVVLLLTAADSDTVLPTINSRCRTVNLRPIPTALIEETLLTRPLKEDKAHDAAPDPALAPPAPLRPLSPEEATLLAHLADGRLGWAIRAHAEPALLQERQEQLDVLNRALGDTLPARFALAESLAKKGEALPGMLRTWLSWWRDLALLAYGPRNEEPLSNIDHVEQLYHLAGRWPRARVLASLQETEAALRYLGQNANGRLVLENIFLTYPRVV